MGMNTSLMRGKGFSTSPMLTLAMNKLYNQFIDKNIKEFEDFHVGILDTFNTINVAILRKHYDAPSYKDVKEIFKRWKESNEEARKEMFIEFMNKNVNLSKVDESMIITAIVAPPVAMMAKRTGQRKLKFMNVIPDVVFVPSATILALIAVKILRSMYIGNGTTSKVAKGSLINNIQKIELDSNATQDIQKTELDSNATQDIQKNELDSNVTQDIIKVASNAHNFTSKGEYCALCKKVHD